MGNYINNVKRSLFSCIREMSTMPWLFVKNPETDFTRKKKLDFETFMKLFISMEGRSVDNELLDFLISRHIVHRLLHLISNVQKYFQKHLTTCFIHLQNVWQNQKHGMDIVYLLAMEPI